MTENVETFPITKGAGYDGVRVECLACLGKIPVKLKVDVGFGDVLYPGPEHCLVDSLIEGIPAAEVVCYPKESLIAEEFQAMTVLGRLNTRMKDFYDIRFLSQHFEFEAFTLSEAIGRTFTHRRTDLDFARSLFTEEFVASRQVQWKAFFLWFVFPEWARMRADKRKFDKGGAVCEIMCNKPPPLSLLVR